MVMCHNYIAHFSHLHSTSLAVSSQNQLPKKHSNVQLPQNFISVGIRALTWVRTSKTLQLSSRDRLCRSFLPLTLVSFAKITHDLITPISAGRIYCLSGTKCRSCYLMFEFWNHCGSLLFFCGTWFNFKTSFLKYCIGFNSNCISIFRLEFWYSNASV